MNINRELIEKFYGGLDERSQEALDAAAERVVAAKKRGGKVAVVTGAGAGGGIGSAAIQIAKTFGASEVIAVVSTAEKGEAALVSVDEARSSNVPVPKGLPTPSSRFAPQAEHAVG